MIIAATGDTHLPKSYHEFLMAVDKMKKSPDLFLVTGDVVHHGDVSEWEKFYNVIFGKVSCPIVACFGNNEFQQLRDDLKSRYRDIVFLDDQSVTLNAGEKTVGVFGTTGSLDTPTHWQTANVPNIEALFRDRIEMADKALQSMQSDVKILMTHYAPTYRTLEGENPRFFPSLGSKNYEPVIESRKPTLVVHGHAHQGSKQAWIDTVPIFNVSFPLNKEIVLIDIDQLKPGLSRFV